MPQCSIVNHWAQKGRAILFTCVSIIIMLCMDVRKKERKHLLQIHLQVIVGLCRSKSVGHDRFVQETLKELV